MTADSVIQTFCYYVFTGPSRPVSDIMDAARSAASATNVDGHILLDLAGDTVKLCGIDDRSTACDCIWLHVPKVKMDHRAALGKLAQALGWTVRSRVGRFHGDRILPPETDNLVANASKQVSTPWYNRSCSWFPGIFFVIAALLYGSIIGDLLFGPVVPVRVITFLVLTVWVVAIAFSFRGSSRGISLALWLTIGMPFLSGFLRFWQDVGLIDALLLYAALALVFAGFAGVLNWYMRRQVRRTNDAPPEAGKAALSAVFVGTCQDSSMFRARLAGELCLTCGYDLRGLATCRCPECGAQNHWLLDREDAIPLALEHGAILPHTASTRE